MAQQSIFRPFFLLFRISLLGYLVMSPMVEGEPRPYHSKHRQHRIRYHTHPADVLDSTPPHSDTAPPPIATLFSITLNETANCTRVRTCRDCLAITPDCVYAACGPFRYCVSNLSELETAFGVDASVNCQTLNKCLPMKRSSEAEDQARKWQQWQSQLEKSFFSVPQGPAHRNRTGHRRGRGSRGRNHMNHYQYVPRDDPLGWPPMEQVATTSTTAPSSSQMDEQLAAYYRHFFSKGRKNGGNGDNAVHRRVAAALHRLGIGNGQVDAKYHQLVYHISLGTMIALLLCSLGAIGAVGVVALKKIHKIYAASRSNLYGTLHEDN